MAIKTDGQIKLSNIVTSVFGCSTCHITAIKDGQHKNKIQVVENTEGSKTPIIKGFNYYAFTSNKLTDLLIYCDDTDYYKEKYHYFVSSIINLTMTAEEYNPKTMGLMNLSNKLTKLNLMNFKLTKIKIKQNIKMLVLNSINIDYNNTHNITIKAEHIIVNVKTKMEIILVGDHDTKDKIREEEESKFSLYDAKVLSLYFDFSPNSFSCFSSNINLRKIKNNTKILHLYFPTTVKSLFLPDKLEELALNNKKYTRNDALFYENNGMFDKFDLLLYKNKIYIVEAAMRAQILFVLFVANNTIGFKNILFSVFLLFILMKNMFIFYDFKKNNMKKIIGTDTSTNIVAAPADHIMFLIEGERKKNQYVKKKIGTVSFLEYEFMLFTVNMTITKKINQCYHDIISYKWQRIFSPDNMFLIVILFEWIYIFYHMHIYLIILNMIKNIIIKCGAETTSNIMNDKLLIENITKDLKKITAPCEYKKQLVEFENEININYTGIY
jgi:hypothetical protein